MDVPCLQQHLQIPTSYSVQCCVVSGSILPLCLGIGVGPDRAEADAIQVQPTQAF